MQIIKNGAEVIFTGNALVDHGRDVLSADKIVQDKKNNIVDAFGNVDFKSVTADTEPVRCFSGRAHYEMKTQKGRLWENRPLAEWWSLTSTSPVTMQADTIDIDQAKGEMVGEGAVNIISSSGTISSPFAHFYQHEKKLVLTNGTFQPEITYVQPDSRGRYRADNIVMLMNDKKAVLTGNVWGRVLFKEQPK
jgi:lipopolysaccharide export system protein LptA